MVFREYMLGIEHVSLNPYNSQEDSLRVKERKRENATNAICSHFSYLLMATTHLHRPSAAVDAFLIFAGSKSGLVMYSLRIFVM